MKHHHQPILGIQSSFFPLGLLQQQFGLVSSLQKLSENVSDDLGFTKSASSRIIVAVLYIGNYLLLYINKKHFNQFHVYLRCQRAEPSIAIEGIQIREVLLTQREVEDVEILLDPRFGDGFGNGDNSTVYLIPQQDLGGRLLVFGRQLLQFGIVHELGIAGFGPRTVRGAQGAVSRHDDVL